MPLYNSLDPTSQSASTTASELANSLSTTASQIAATNTNRKGLTIYNSLSVTVYVDFNNLVTASNFMFKLQPNSFYEMPNSVYTGPLWAVLSSGNGSVEIREFT